MLREEELVFRGLRKLGREGLDRSTEDFSLDRWRRDECIGPQEERPHFLLT